MKFSKIIGNCDPKLVEQAQDALTKTFTELSLRFDVKDHGSKLGGDVLIFQLVYPIPHFCDASAIAFDALEKEVSPIYEKIADERKLHKEEEEKIAIYEKLASRKYSLLRTAATSGKAYYWNPQFVIDQTPIGRRLLVCHEGHHSWYMHPTRRGSRNPKLWNICVDFKVNNILMQDLKSRGVHDPGGMFKDNLGDFISFKDYAILLKDPYNPPPALDHLNPIHDLRKMFDPKYIHPGENKKPMYYADVSLSDEMKMPENIYDYLYSIIPRCKECGRFGKYEKSKEYKDLEKKISKSTPPSSNQQVIKEPKKKSWLSSLFG